MNINEMKYGEVIELKKALEGAGLGVESKGGVDNEYYKVGGNIFIRTVTHIVVGKLLAVYPTELVVNNASWIADTGRYADSMKDFGNFSEVEPYPVDVEVIVNRSSIIDAHMTNQQLPTEQK